MSKALIVVDCQNDFLLNEGSLNIGHDTKDIRENIASLVKNFEGHLYLTLDSHQDDDCEFQTFPKHCIVNTYGHQIIDEIDNVLKNRPFDLFSKKSFTGAFIINLANKLADNDIKEIHVIGVCTHICIHDIIATIVNHTKDVHGYIPEVIVHEKLVDDFNPEMAKFALQRMQNLYGVKLV